MRNWVNTRSRRGAALLLAAALVCSALAGAGGAPAEAEPAVDTGSAKACFLTELTTDTAVFSFNADAKLPAAGLAKLAPLLIACEAFDGSVIGDDAPVTVGAKAAGLGGTTAFLREGERMSAGELLRAAVMINAGDAVHALAEAVCGGEKAALDRINGRLEQLGIDGGLSEICEKDAPFSARELAALGAALTESPAFLRFSGEYCAMLAHSGAGETELVNPNRLIRSYPGCTGVGTGSSNAAGYCGVFAAKRNGAAFIAVVMGAGSSAERFAIAQRMLDLGFDGFCVNRIGASGEAFGTVPVTGSAVGSVDAVLERETAVLTRSESGKCRIEARLPEVLQAPVEQGGAIGSLLVLDGAGAVIAQAELVADRSAGKTAFRDCFRLLLGAFTRLNAPASGQIRAKK